jgi:hypothetical protein
MKDNKIPNPILAQTLTSVPHNKSPSKIVGLSIKSPPKSPIFKSNDTIFTNKGLNPSKSKTKF